MASSRPSILIVEIPGLAPRFYVLSASSVQIGRVDGNAVMVEEDSVSSRHCELRRTGSGGFEVRDLGSTNGTRLNGVVLSSDARELYDGDELLLGARAKLRFVRALEVGVEKEPSRSSKETATINMGRPNRQEQPTINPVAAAMAKAAKAKI